MKTRTEKIEDFFNELDTSIDVLDYIDPETVESFEDVYDQIDGNGGFDVEIIYYARAMDYLRENDPSLLESMKIAEEYGYSPGDLNSETLASLHASQAAREEIQELADDINDFFDTL